MRISRRLFAALALLLACLACERPTPTSTPLPLATPAISDAAPVLPALTLAIPASATAPATAIAPSRTPTLSPTPAGRLLSVLRELDLSLPAGNLYEPSEGALSADGERLYLLGKASLGEPEYALGQVDVVAGQLSQTAFLPGYSSGPIVVGGGSIYLTYASPGEPAHLSKLSETGLRVTADVSISSTTVTGLALDELGGRLYLATDAGLEVRSAGDLLLLNSHADLRAARLTFDRSARRLYLALNQELRAYDAAFALLWQQSAAGQVEDLMLTPDGRTLYWRAESWGSGTGAVNALCAVDAASGQTRFAPQSVLPGYWVLAAADEGRAYLIVNATGGAYIALVDARGQVVARYTPAGGYPSTVLYDAGSQRLYLPNGRNHLLEVLDAETLAPLGQIPVGVEIRGIAVGVSRLYVNDSSSRLRALDPESLQLLGATQAANGSRIVLDEAAQRLYIARDGRQEIAVVDTQAMTVTAVITGGDRLAVDSRHGRLFIGYAPVVYEAKPVGEVRILDQKSLKPLGAIPRPGVPAYNPLRDELYVTDVSAYIYDGASYQPLGELIPEIGTQAFRGCNGCKGVRDLYISPERDLLVADMTVYSVGAGPGMYPSPRYFALRSLAPLAWPVAATFTCEGCVRLQSPTDGLLYSSANYTRYVSYQNLVARRAGSEEIVRWRDGLNAALVIPSSRVIYASRAGESLLALDMDSWLPLGHIPFYDVHALDLDAHRLYAVADSRLIVLRDRGGQPMPAVPAERADKLPAIDRIYLSPDYDRDRTLWVVGGGQVIRSSDGGASWAGLGGGLPRLRSQPLDFRLAISPSYPQDHTLYAGVDSGSTGYGVWRSTDGGDSWEPLWQGLEQLHVTGFAFSPHWPSDGTLVAYTRYQRLLPTMQSGEELYRSTDRGAHWSLTASRSDPYSPTPLPGPGDLWPGSAPAVQLASRDGAGTMSRSGDGGRTWELVLALPNQPYISDIAAVPGTPETYYLTAASALYRTRDAGDTWEVAVDSRITDHGVWTQEWRHLALARQEAGGEWVFLGDSEGNLLSLRSDALTWRPFRAPLPTVAPSALYPTATPHLIPVTITPAPTPVEPPNMTATPTPCLLPFGQTFDDHADMARAAVGCPGAEERRGALVTQRFEHGRMFWREEGRQIYVLFDDGTWRSYQDTWQEGQPVSDGTLTAPPGNTQPVRGFGKIWREALGGPNSAIGWALQGETGYSGAWQVCAVGLLLTDEVGGVYALRSDGRWLK